MSFVLTKRPREEDDMLGGLGDHEPKVSWPCNKEAFVFTGTEKRSMTDTGVAMTEIAL